MQGGTLMAAPFDARRLALTGGAIPALEGVAQSVTTGAAQYGVSSTGTLVYLSGGMSGSQSRMVWVSRGEEHPLPADPLIYAYPRVSPDGQRVAVAIAGEEQHIWVYDTTRNSHTRLTLEGNNNSAPIWSRPDGTRIAFTSSRAGPLNMFWQPADGSGHAEQLHTSDFTNSPSSFSPDGQLLAFVESAQETGRDIWVMRLSDRTVHPFLNEKFEETAPQFSPDGKWLAYSSDDSGRREIYVRPYPGPGGRSTISSEGGQEPVWNPKGGELFYRSGNKLMAVEVDTKAGFSAGNPKTLFEGPYLPTTASLPFYDVSPDGQRFLMLKPVESQTPPPTQINVVLNWFDELKKKLPTGK
jgi:serine/threonine-protein kinase